MLPPPVNELTERLLAGADIVCSASIDMLPPEPVVEVAVTSPDKLIEPIILA